MIKNERQLRVAERKLEEVRAAIESASDPNEVRSLDAFAKELRDEIEDFLNVSGGFVNTFGLESMDDLPDALVRARIAKGWSQGDLAEELGVSGQMVQKDEAGGYERAGIDRLADAADALGYELRGVLHPKSETATFHILRVDTMPAPAPRLAAGEVSSRATFYPNCVVGRRERPVGGWSVTSERADAVGGSPSFGPTGTQAGTSARSGITTQQEGALP